MDTNALIGIGLASAVLFGMASAAVAQHKGHRTGGPFLLGALLGVLGLVIVACMPRVQRPAPTGWYADGYNWRYWDGQQWL